MSGYGKYIREPGVVGTDTGRVPAHTKPMSPSTTQQLHTCNGIAATETDVDGEIVI